MTTTSNGASPQAVWIDTNILVYANPALSPFHQRAVERLREFERQGCELWISRQALSEYFSAMTKQNVLTKDFTQFLSVITILPLEVTV